MTDYGIDLSHWNRVNDWNAVHGNNISFASIKLTESIDYIDPASAGHVDGARAAGVRPGGYHFARATAVHEQVDHFASQLSARGLLGNGALAPMLDMEAAELRGNGNAFVASFIGRLRDVTGVRRVLVYANLDWFTHVLDPNQWADTEVFLWIARYNGDPGNPGWNHPRLALHQHTSKGNVPGIPGNVDRDATMPGYAVDQLTLGGAPAPPAPPAPAPAPGTYTVQPGDTLSLIASRFGTTWQELQRINHIPNANLIYPGQIIVLPSGAPAPAPPAPAPARTYTVVRGDTLSGIAARFGTTWQELQRINAIPNPNRIFPGQVLRLP